MTDYLYNYNQCRRLLSGDGWNWGGGGYCPRGYCPRRSNRPLISVKSRITTSFFVPSSFPVICGPLYFQQVSIAPYKTLGLPFAVMYRSRDIFNWKILKQLLVMCMNVGLCWL